MIRYILIPIPFAVTWVLLTNQPKLFSLGLGYAVALIMAVLLVPRRVLDRPLNTAGFSLRLLSAMIFIVRLLWDIFLSGIDVALRVIGIRNIQHTGIIAVDVGDDDEIIAGLSAHAITITPGELVVAYDEDDKIMYVHCMDVQRSRQSLPIDQARRVERFRRILGHD